MKESEARGVHRPFKLGILIQTMYMFHRCSVDFILQIHATDYSNASGTALYDPFIEDWNQFFLGVFGIPHSIFPELRPSVGNWGSCSADLFGAEIPITAVVSSRGYDNFDISEVK